MKWLIRLQEMTYSRPKVKDAIDDHIQQILENWFMLEASKRDPERFSEPAYHWLEELCAQLEPGIRKIQAVGFKQRAVDKLVDEVFISDAHLDNPEKVRGVVQRKMKKEHVPQDVVESILTSWLERGIHEITNVFKHDVSSVTYEELKDAELQGMKE